MPYIFGTTELNVGIICSCLPVTFVVFKGVNVSGPWTSFVRYVRARSRGKRRAASDPLEAMDSSSYLAKETKASVLPKIPRATMTGLSSFIGRSNSRALAHSGQNIMVNTELSTFGELSSVENTSHPQPGHQYPKCFITDPSGYYYANYPQGHHFPQAQR